MFLCCGLINSSSSSPPSSGSHLANFKSLSSSPHVPALTLQISSAYEWLLTSCAEATSAKSFVYKISRHGPRTEPCGTDRTTLYLHIRPEMTCPTDMNWTIGELHREDQTSVQVEASEGLGRRCQIKQAQSRDITLVSSQETGVDRCKPSSLLSPCCGTDDRLTVSPASSCCCPKPPEVVSAQISPKAWYEMTDSKQVYSSSSGWWLIRVSSAVGELRLS